MTTDYAKLAENNILDYGRKLEDWAPNILGGLYGEKTHFIYEIIQNAEDVNAKWIRFELLRDRLIIRHNGKVFSEANVRGICGLGEGTKRDDLTQIGKFGIGFKSVYVYTRTPEIYSGDEAFCVEGLVKPRGINQIDKAPNETVFSLPFNNEKMSAEQAYSDISFRLKNLGIRTILFLFNIKDIRWSIGTESGNYSRKIRPINDHCKKCQLVSEICNNIKESEDWLIFEKPVTIAETNNPRLRIEVAFKIEKNRELGKEEIVPINDSKLVVFFPTEKETHLKFLIQGPFRTTPTRENIPPDEPVNVELVKMIASLVSTSLPEIKDMGLLNVEFLNVLPILKLDFPEGHMFRPIYDTVLSKLKSNDKLLPGQGGRYLSAQESYLARGEQLTELLNQTQLEQLFGKTNCHWLASNITDSKTPAIRSYLMSELNIQEITADKLAAQINEAFIEQQSDNWIIKFYTYLKSVPNLWQKWGTLRHKPIIRLENNTHKAPFAQWQDKPQVYLPGAITLSLLPTVKRYIFDNKQAKEFLIALGLTEPDKIAEIITTIFPQYRADTINVSDEANIEHVKAVVDAMKSASSNQRRELIDGLGNGVYLLKAVEMKSKDLYYCKPSDVYLTSFHTGKTDVDIFFENNPDIYVLSDVYDSFTKDDLLLLGCNERILVFYNSNKDSSGNVMIADSHGNHKRGIHGFDPNCTIEGVAHALNQITYEKAKIIWNIAKNYHFSITGSVESSRYANYTNPIHKTEISTLGKLLRINKWLPDKNGGFHLPSEIIVSDLAEEFDKTSLEAKTLAKNLGFKNDIEQEYLAQAPEDERKKIELIKKIPLEKLQELYAEIEKLEHIIDEQSLDFHEELKKAFDRPQLREKENDFLPPNENADLNKRALHVQKDIKENQKNEPSKLERFKRIPVKVWESKNNEARVFLKEQYNGKCQICGYSFKKRNGDPYFEGVYLVSHTKASWIDRSGNILCLCANCAAKFEHGAVEADNIQIQMSGNNFEPSDHKLKIRLCGEDVILKYSSRHLLDLQELIKASSVIPN